MNKKADSCTSSLAVLRLGMVRPRIPKLQIARVVCIFFQMYNGCIMALEKLILARQFIALRWILISAFDQRILLSSKLVKNDPKIKILQLLPRFCLNPRYTWNYLEFIRFGYESAFKPDLVFLLRFERLCGKYTYLTICKKYRWKQICKLSLFIPKMDFIDI